jgi:hypothetical protein
MRECSTRKWSNITHKENRIQRDLSASFRKGKKISKECQGPKIIREGAHELRERIVGASKSRKIKLKGLEC